MTHQLDVLIRYVLLPALGLWATYRLVRELTEAVRDYRRGEW